MKIVFLLGSLLLLSVAGLAHEGHDHDAPTTIKPVKGGVVKALDEAKVEVVAKGKNVKIYVFDKDMKAAPSARFTILAKTALPRGKKEEDLALTAKENFFEAEYDAKGSHRYTLKLAVTDANIKRTDQLSFTIEPRK
jgi:hypothetical protein